MIKYCSCRALKVTSYECFYKVYDSYRNYIGGHRYLYSEIIDRDKPIHIICVECDDTIDLTEHMKTKQGALQ